MPITGVRSAQIRPPLYLGTLMNWSHFSFRLGFSLQLTLMQSHLPLKYGVLLNFQRWETIFRSSPSWWLSLPQMMLQGIEFQIAKLIGTRFCLVNIWTTSHLTISLWNPWTRQWSWVSKSLTLAESLSHPVLAYILTCHSFLPARVTAVPFLDEYYANKCTCPNWETIQPILNVFIDSFGGTFNFMTISQPK